MKAFAERPDRTTRRELVRNLLQFGEVGRIGTANDPRAADRRGGRKPIPAV